MSKILCLLESIHKVIAAEKVIAGEKIVYQIIPVPKQITTECGMAIQIEAYDQIRVETLLQKKSIPVRFYNQ